MSLLSSNTFSFFCSLWLTVRLRSLDSTVIERIWSEMDNGILYLYIPKSESVSREVPVLRGGYVNSIDKEHN